MRTPTVHILDLQFLGSSDTIAAFLLPSEAGWILIETGPYSTFSTLKREVEKHGITLADIRHVFITHIHFDHAGAAWALAALGAKIYLHPFGEKHLHEPTKLYESARRIYQDNMDKLWGKMEGIAFSQLQTIDHEVSVSIGELQVKALHTPGHAIHHIAWQIGDIIFTGDVGGVKINNGLVFAPCPPPDIHVEDWQASIRLLKNAAPSKIYLTHFGEVTDVQAHFEQLENRLLDWASWMKPYSLSGESVETITPKFAVYVASTLRDAGITDALELEKYEKANPSWMSVSGLLRYWSKKQSV